MLNERHKEKVLCAFIFFIVLKYLLARTRGKQKGDPEKDADRSRNYLLMLGLILITLFPQWFLPNYSIDLGGLHDFRGLHDSFFVIASECDVVDPCALQGQSRISQFSPPHSRPEAVGSDRTLRKQLDLNLI